MNIMIYRIQYTTYPYIWDFDLKKHTITIPKIEAEGKEPHENPGRWPKKFLTHRQEMFCVSYIETGNATESYRRHYTTQNTKPININRQAKKMIDDPKIQARITELRAPIIKKALLSVEEHLNTLQELRDGAVSSDKFSAAVQAEIARGKVCGLYVEKHAITDTDGNDISQAARNEKAQRNRQRMLETLRDKK